MNRSINVKSDRSYTGQTERLQKRSTSTWMRALMWNQIDHAQVKQKGRSKLGVKCCSVTEISAFSRDFCTATWHCFASIASWWSLLVCCLALNAEVSWTQYKFVFVFCQLDRWSRTTSLFSKHDTSLFGCPCCSHALLKPCELCVLLFAVGLLGYCSLLVGELTLSAKYLECFWSHDWHCATDKSV